MLIIQPSGGLCNRIRSINSAFFLSRSLGRSLRVIWQNNEELNCPFDKLYQLPKEIKIIETRSKYNLQKLLLQLKAKQRFSNDDILNNKTAGVLHQDFIDQLSFPVYISTCEEFYSAEDYRLFVPTPAIQTQIDQITDRLGSYSVGVHIRRTDNATSILNSSTDQFISKLEEEIKNHPKVKFFLATDDQQEEKNLLAHFPEHIVVQENKTLSRNSIKGMQDALVDLQCLSLTTKIYGSYWSSFTDIAADMRKIPKIIVGQAD